MPKRVSKSYFVSCAQEGIGSATTATAPTESNHFRKLFRCMLSLSRNRSLEIKIKSSQHFARIQVAAVRRSSVLMQPVIFVVPSEARAAGHERVVPETESVG